MPATNDSQRPRIELRLHFVTRHVHVDGATPTQACLSKRNGREASASTFERIQHANTSWVDELAVTHSAITALNTRGRARRTGPFAKRLISATSLPFGHAFS